MKISIVTTAFNAEKYIEETIESVLTQRGNFEVEYIIIDAKSSDSTLTKIVKYKNLVDADFYKNYNLGATMTVISESDNGMYDGIAKGLKLATGDVVAYINSDDFYLPNAFSCVCEIFEKFEQVNWLTGRANCFNDKGHFWESILPAHFHKDLILKGFYGSCLPVIQQESTFWRKKLLDELDMDAFKSFKLAGDFYMWHSFAKTNELYIINSNLGGFRFNKGQKSMDKTNYKKEFEKITENYSPTLIESLKISHLKRSRVLSDKRKMRRNKSIIRFDLDKNAWTLG